MQEVLSPPKQPPRRNKQNSEATNSNLWQQLISKTQDNKVNLNQSNHSLRRGCEDILSGRTVNPQKYPPQANLLLETSEVKKSKAEKALESKPSYETITGCTRGNKFKTKDTLQLSYSKEELNQFLSPKKSIRRDTSQQDHFKDSANLNSSMSCLLGGSKIPYILSDKKVNATQEKSSTTIKNMRDYRSDIPCLQNSQKQQKKQTKGNYNTFNETSMERKMNRNLLTSFETGSMLQSSHNIQMPITEDDRQKQLSKKILKEKNKSPEMNFIFQPQTCRSALENYPNTTEVSSSRGKKRSGMFKDAFKSQVEFV